jgi:large subunit ribosomal protein L21
MAQKATQTKETETVESTKESSKATKTAPKAPKKTKGDWKTPLEFPYAVFTSGGKQFCVSKGDQLLVEKIELDPGAEWVSEDVLMLSQAPGKYTYGKPTVKGAKVKCEVLQQGLGPKILIRHSRRRQSSQKTLGHRQPQTRLLVKEILA